MRKDLLDKDIIEHVIAVLNRSLNADQEAINSLVNQRVICNEQLALDPTIQCGSYHVKNEYTVGILGIINGILGSDPNTKYGPVAAVLDNDGKLLRFEHSDKCALSDG